MEPDTPLSILSSLFSDDESLLLRLLVAHILTDFVLQTGSLVRNRFEKGWSSSWLYIHGLIAGMLIYIFSGLWHTLWLPFVIFLTHTCIDGARVPFKNTTRILVIDQLAHTTIIFFCWIVARGQAGQSIASAVDSVPSGTDIWAVVLGYLFVYSPASVFIERFTAPWREEIEPAGDKGLTRAGMWIGRLERLLTVTFVLLNRYEAIGFLITAKSILRFGETRAPGARKEAEYILIGTMLSFTAAIFVGLGVRWLLAHN